MQQDEMTNVFTTEQVMYTKYHLYFYNGLKLINCF